MSEEALPYQELVPRERFSSVGPSAQHQETSIQAFR